MKINITYPHIEKKKRQRQDIINQAKWPFVLAAVACAIVNISVGPPAWSLIALWSIWMVWTIVISPDLVEYNRIRLWIRLITNTSVLLIIIDLLFPPGWSIDVVPIVYFSGMAIAGVLFFTDLVRQKQNMMPMLTLIAIALISSAAGLIIWHNWELIVMGATALTLLIVSIIVLGKDFVREFQKRFHIR